LLVLRAALVLPEGLVQPPGIQPNLWVDLSIKTWWDYMTTNAVPSRKAVASLSLLVLWEIWNEKNARVFYNKHVPHAVILKKE
jgi:hypothetical protein